MKRALPPWSIQQTEKWNVAVTGLCTWNTFVWSQSEKQKPAIAKLQEGMVIVVKTVSNISSIIDATRQTSLTILLSMLCIWCWIISLLLLLQVWTGPDQITAKPAKSNSPINSEVKLHLALVGTFRRRWRASNR